MIEVDENGVPLFDIHKTPIFWFINKDTDEKYDIYASGHVEGPFRFNHGCVEGPFPPKKGITFLNKIVILQTMAFNNGHKDGYEKGYNAAKSEPA
jgi:hypothetical protein